MKRLYLVPNMITAFGLACGLFVIFKVNMIEPGSGYYEVMRTSAILLLIAALADLIDGALARVFKTESQFGFNFDSMADAVSFGVAPSVLLLKSLSLEPRTWLSFFATTATMIYSLCGVLRLVRYNVKEAEAKGNIDEKDSQKKHFTGLPITISAIAAVSINLFLLSPFFIKIAEISENTRVIILSSIMVVLGYFMVSRWKFPSLKCLHIRIRSFYLVVFTVFFAICILYGILYFFSVILVIVPWAYIICAWILSIIRLIAGRKSKTLEEFEPDHEDTDLM